MVGHDAATVWRDLCRGDDNAAVYAILEFPDGPALSVGYRSRAAAEAALRRLLDGDARYARFVVAEVETVTPRAPVTAGTGTGRLP
jgi:hypothetical protein